MFQSVGLQKHITNSFAASACPGPRSSKSTTELDEGLLVFLEQRRNIFGIAYRMLKDSAEAEDIVQEIWMRWQKVDRNSVYDPPAFLATATTRMCINFCKSARTRRETYVDSWLSEPIAINGAPGHATERADAMRTVVGILLERLRPAERAAYILRVAFDYSARQIADVLRTTEANVRQLLTRARKHVAECGGGHARASEQQNLLPLLLDAIESGDIDPLEELFAPNETLEVKVGGAKSKSKVTTNIYGSIGFQKVPVHRPNIAVSSSVVKDVTTLETVVIEDYSDPSKSVSPFFLRPDAVVATSNALGRQN